MKKVMVCGCGAQGSTICRKLDQEPNIEEVICADYDLEAAKDVCRLMTKGTPKQVDATYVEEIKKAAEDSELIVNVMPLDFGKNVLRAAMDLKCCYQDLSGCENIPECMHIDPYDRWIGGVQYMYDGYGKVFRENDTTAIVGTGSSPGVMCVMARKAVQQLDECDTICMMVYEGVEAKRFIPFWWSPDVALADMEEDAYGIVDEKIIRTDPFSHPIYRTWPEMNNRTVKLVDHAHEEPVFLGFNRKKYFKNAKNLFFKYGGVGINWAYPLKQADLLSYEPEEIDGVQVVPHDLVRKHTPAAPKDPEEIREIIEEGLVADEGAFVVEAYGRKDGKDVMVDLHLFAPGLVESYERAKMTAEMYLTGQGAFLYTKLLVNDRVTEKGLITSDMLDDEQVDQYVAWAADLGITYTIDIREGVKWTESPTDGRPYPENIRMKDGTVVYYGR